MLKRISAFALALCLLFAAALLPAAPTEAATLPGWSSKVDYDNTDPSRFAIEIDLVNQVLTVYERAIGGTIVLQSLCTTGNAENPTGAGTYKLGDMKERFGYFVAFGQYAQYWTQVVRGIYIHSVMYNSQKLTSMSKSAYRDLGKNVSHGCVRVLPHVAQFIYYNCPPGTVCKIVRNKAKDPGLVAAIKRGIPSYSDYVQPQDDRPWPVEIPAVVRYDGTPLRTGFSNSRDTTLATLSAGEQVLLLQLADDWCKVRLASGKLGYVKTPYLLAYPDERVISSTEYKAKSKTYVYAAMDTGSKRLATVPAGALPAVDSNPKTGWWHGSYNGVTGYLRTKYVVKTTTVAYPYYDPLTGAEAAPGYAGLLPGTTLPTPAPVLTPAPVQTPAPATGGLAGGQTSGKHTSGAGGLSGGLAARPTPTPTPAPNVISVGETGNAYIRAGIKANVRTGAGTEFPLVATLDPGTPVTVLSVAGTWFYCRIGAITGYIYANLLSTL